MADLPIRIQLRRGDITEWVNNDIVLARGEPAIELYPNDASLYGVRAGKPKLSKVGDDVTPYSQLPYQLFYYPITRNNRPQRNLNEFATLVQPGGERETIPDYFELLDKLLHPYAPPRLQLSGTPPFFLEVGQELGIVLTLFNIVQGSFPLRDKRIVDIDSNLVIQAVTAAVGAFINTAQIQGSPTVTRNTAGSRNYRGSVTDTKPDGNVTVESNIVSYQFKHPIFFGVTSVLPATVDGFSDAQMSSFLLGSDFAQNLNDLNQEHICVPNTQFIYYAFPAALGDISIVNQLGVPGNIRNTSFRQLNKNITKAGTGAAPKWANVPYKILGTVNPTGNGSTTKFTFLQ